MKFYCLLLLIILLCCLYDNNLYEGNGEYDELSDRTVSYNQSIQESQDTILQSIGIASVADWFLGVGQQCLNDSDCLDADEDGNYMPGCVRGDDNIYRCPPETELSNCEEYVGEGNDDKTCAELVPLQHNPDFHWDYYREDSWDSTRDTPRDKCATCMRCKDNNSFPKKFYGYYCDATVACIDDPNITTDKLPYLYAMDKIDWDNDSDCGNTANRYQKMTCAIGGSLIMDMYTMANKVDIIGCSSDIVEQEAENELLRAGNAVGDFVSDIGDDIGNIFH